MAGARARRCLEPLRERLHPDTFESLRLLVTELVNNSLRHSGRPEGDPIVLTVELGGGEVRAEVVDHGSGRDAFRASPSVEGESGWGLYLVDRLADEWGYSREGPTRVWFELSTRPSGEVRSARPWSEQSQAGSA
jgi:anti-sigma regulatory factor (Ser/Thr protein kinase)